MATVSPQLEEWLLANYESYEFYLIHRILHDSTFRDSLVLQVKAEDFKNEVDCLIYGAIKMGCGISQVIGTTVPAPPNVEWIRTYMEAVNKKEEWVGPEELGTALSRVEQILAGDYREYWYVIDPLFELWLTSVRAKAVAKGTMRSTVVNADEMVQNLQRDINAARSVIYREEDDGFFQAMNGDVDEMVERFPTGIPGLDECLNGGYARGETYLLFSGTGGGKSIIADQTTIYQGSVGIPSLIVSTELKEIEHIVRMISNMANVKIGLIQDCQNVRAIRSVVAARDPSRLQLVDAVIDYIRKWIRIKRVSAEAGMTARGIIEKEVRVMEDKMGISPAFVAFDWLGTAADVNGGAGGFESSKRAAMWEVSANGIVQYGLDHDKAILVLAQAVNGAEMKSILVQGDIGISKGIGKNMVACVGLTNTIDKKGIAEALKGNADAPKSNALIEQYLCVTKARKGEGRNVPVKREYGYQRLGARLQGAR